MPRNLNDWAKIVHENAKAHGWWEPEKSFPEAIALCHAELSEALEEYRNGRAPIEVYGNPASGHPDKPEGIPIELADCIIRILDYCEHAGIDIEDALRRKHEYNKTRPFRHGGKLC